MYGLFSVFGFIASVLKEQYNKSHSKERHEQYEKEQCESLGIPPFEVRMKMIKEQQEWREKNGLS